MKSNKRAEFLKSLRLPVEEKAKKYNRSQSMQRDQIDEITRQEEIDLQQELDRRFNDLFGMTEEE